MNRENIFVFVVCGGVEHIDALHYSLEALRKVSKHRIIVLTDSLRNEIAIEHDNIIDVATPENYNHHKASIYLKTGIHKFLPTGNLYCYLDTDVVALDESVDNIFNEYAAPITFAPDHCVADQFSPSAMKCGCAEKFAAWEAELKSLFIKYKHHNRQPENTQKKILLEERLKEIKANKLLYKWISFRFNLAKKKFRLHKDAILLKQEGMWVDNNGEPILYEHQIPTIDEMIEKNHPYSRTGNFPHKWLREGKDVFDARCPHLHEAINQTFGFEIKEEIWQHWNGGVFLFDEKSIAFLDDWHENTQHIFNVSNWKTRDQGTLIATAWKFGLEKHKTLSKKFNLLADYQNKAIKHQGDLHFKFFDDEESLKPAFIHVYHHWGDKKWDVWNTIERQTGIEVYADNDLINGLWIGSTLSPIELLTIKSFLHNGNRFKLWIYEPITTTLPQGVEVGDANEIIPSEKIFRYKNKSQFGHGKGSVAGFSDIFRYKLLFEKGGWWVDMDITCLKPLDYDKPYFFRKHHNLNVVGNVMKCPKGSLLMKRCYEEAIAEIDEHNTDWHKPIDILNKHIDALELNSYTVNNVSNQDRWDDTSRFIYNNEEYSENWNFIHWQNEEWRNKKLDKSFFYYKSTLADLLKKNGLYEPPDNLFALWKNKLLFSTFIQKIRERI